eukprot:13497231-Ditylum_brightwellii.AAC.1
MEIDAFHEEHGNRTVWDKYSDNSNNKGDWIKALSRGKCLFSFKVRTEKKAEENAVKKLKNEINILSVEKQGSDKQNCYGRDSSNTQAVLKPNHDTMANNNKEREEKEQKDSEFKSPEKETQAISSSRDLAQ